ncbi:hypothetical protein [Microbacterium sp. NPDC055455]
MALADEEIRNTVRVAPAMRGGVGDVVLELLDRLNALEARVDDLERQHAIGEDPDVEV